MEWDRKRLE